MEKEIKLLLVLSVLFLNVNIASADITGWHEVVDVTDFSTGGMFLNDTGLGIARVFLLEIKSGEVTDINVDSDTYTVEIDISEPDWKTTTMTINTTNLSGVMVSTTHTFTHIKMGSLTSPIYVLIGQPPLEWGVSSQGVIAKTYKVVDLNPANPLVEIPVLFALGWDVYDDRFLEPPVGFVISSDGPITIRYEIQPVDEIYERRDRSIAEFALTLIAKVPYVGPPLALSIEAIGTIMIVFISVVFFAITGWAILFLLFETLVLAHAIAVMKMSGGLAGVVGVFSVIAADNYIMIMFVVNLFTRMFTLLIDLVKALRDMSPI